MWWTNRQWCCEKSHQGVNSRHFSRAHQKEGGQVSGFLSSIILPVLYYNSLGYLKVLPKTETGVSAGTANLDKLKEIIWKEEEMERLFKSSNDKDKQNLKDILSLFYCFRASKIAGIPFPTSVQKPQYPPPLWQAFELVLSGASISKSVAFNKTSESRITKDLSLALVKKERINH